eukprot:TRINITY_DN5552_c0_g1_i2.p1 TRINITY_DN5552_c0_g1~~TRINITY_DN5552_c0_g1_i2.p1  ORF type:complete len:194 (-),score=17.24 TRINITY_DN5552_c0_g1_i2:27-608(-)
MGGSLATSLTYLTIRYSVQKPSKLILCYPILNICGLLYWRYTPSFRFGLTNYCLPICLLNIIHEQYCNYNHAEEYPLKKFNQKYEDNGKIKSKAQKKVKYPLLNPVLASKQIIKHLPPVRFFLSEIDVTNDDCWRFIDKIHQVNGDYKVKQYLNMHHGFLAFEQIKQLPQAKECFKDIIKEINEPLEQKSTIE